MADSMQRRTRKVAVGLLMMGGLWVAVYWWWPVSPPVSFAVVRQQAVTPQRGEEHTSSVSQATRPVVSYATQGKAGAGGRLPTPNPSRGEGLISGVIPPKFATHVVEKGETLESISLMYFGTSKHAEAIARANPMLSPPDLKAGKEVLVPLDPANVQGVVATRTPEEAKIASNQDSATVSEQKKHVNQPQILQEYLVQEGDSLAKIARDVYGSEKDADLIFKANKDKLSDPSKIRIGQKLKIPVKPKG